MKRLACLFFALAATAQASPATEFAAGERRAHPPKYSDAENEAYVNRWATAVINFRGYPGQYRVDRTASYFVSAQYVCRIEGSCRNSHLEDIPQLCGGRAAYGVECYPRSRRSSK